MNRNRPAPAVVDIAAWKIDADWRFQEMRNLAAYAMLQVAERRVLLSELAELSQQPKFDMCLAKAAQIEARAKEITDRKIRRQLYEVAQQWRELAAMRANW
jgi:hypothetical protein